MSRRRYPPNGILMRRKALRFSALQVLSMFRYFWFATLVASSSFAVFCMSFAHDAQKCSGKRKPPVSVFNLSKPLALKIRPGAGLTPETVDGLGQAVNASSLKEVPMLGVLLLVSGDIGQ